MSTFHTCYDCGKEFLGADAVPTGDNIRIACRRCHPHFEICMICGHAFTPPRNTHDADLLNHCSSCLNSITFKEFTIMNKRPLATKIGQRIAAALDKQGIRQSEFARKNNVSKQRVKNWIDGKNLPKPELWNSIEATLDEPIFDCIRSR